VPSERILLGVIGRPHGVRGLVHVHSYTADPADLTEYGVLETAQGRRFRLRWRGEGIAEIFDIVDRKRVAIATREAAQALVNTRLYIPRDKLPPPGEEEFYQADLLGLEAFDAQGVNIGRVAQVHDYGAGTFLEIGTRLLPFTRACVPVVDIAGGRIEVVIPDEIEVKPQGEADDPDAEAVEAASRLAGVSP
jgi:16S rRNA processing protein RimM